jgi:hypothetical protein
MEETFPMIWPFDNSEHLLVYVSNFGLVTGAGAGLRCRQ